MSMQTKPYLVCWQWVENGTGLFIERVALTDAERTDLQGRLDQLFDEGLIADAYLGDEQQVPTPYEDLLRQHPILAEAAPEASMVIRALWDALSAILEDPDQQVEPHLRADGDAAIKLASRFAKRNPEVRKD